MNLFGKKTQVLTAAVVIAAIAYVAGFQEGSSEKGSSLVETAVTGEALLNLVDASPKG